MAAPTIIRGSDHFFATTYEGNGQGQKVGKFIPFTDNGTIAKSVISNPGDNPQLSYDASGDTTTSADKWTFSYWVKRSGLGTTQYLAGVAIDGSNETKLGFDDSNRAFWGDLQSGSFVARLISNRTFEDTSKWYHFVWSMDSTQSTASDRQRLYVDGDEITSWNTELTRSQNNDYLWTRNATHRINWGASEDLDGYLAEINHVDGQQLGPDTFGITDTSTGRWIPKSLGSITYGGTGYRLQFANAAGQTIGDDTSGNGHDFTVSNFTASDITTDSPTQNFTTLDAGNSGSMTLSEGNLRYTTASSSNWESVYSDKSINTGKWYFEVTCKVTTAYDAQPGVILESVMTANKNQLMGYTDGSVGYNMDGSQNVLYYGNSGNNYLVHGATDASTAGVVIGVAYDADTGAMWFAKNNTWVNNGTGAGNPSAGTNATFVEPLFAKQKVRFGFSTYNASASYEINFGAKDFNYTPPTDFKKVQQDNFTDEGFKPDLVWIKNRDAADSHQLYNSSRGVQKDLQSDATNAESTTTDGLQKFLQGGCAIEDDVSINTVAESYVAWNWVANGGTTSANTDGSGANRASTIQANQTAGFSIVTFTSSNDSGFNVDKVAHGLTQGPEWFVFKRTDSTSSWIAYHKDAYASNQHALVLDTTAANATFNTELNPSMFPASPDTNIFSYVSGSAAAKGADFIAYCWHSVEGYSKIGSYEGVNNADGTFVYTGFKPSWLLCKDIDNTRNWVIIDNTRDQINPTDKGLFPNDTAVEATGNTVDFLSNGFKCRTTGTSLNAASTYIFVAFAKHPFIGNGTNPVTAR